MPQPLHTQTFLSVLLFALGVPAVAAAAPAAGHPDASAIEHGAAKHFGNSVTLKLAYVESLRSAVAEEEESVATREGAESLLLARHLAVGAGYERSLIPG